MRASNPVAHMVSWSQLCSLVMFTLQYKWAFAHCKNTNSLLENHRFRNCKWKYWEKFCHKIFSYNSWWTNKLEKSNKNRRLPKILIVASFHVTYAFKSESTLYSYLNVKELLAGSRRKIWSLSDCNWTRTQNHLVRKQTLNHLAKRLSVRLRTKWFWVRVQLQPPKILVYYLVLNNC